MKKRFSTRLLSVFLAVMMVVTSIPFTAVTALAATETLSSDRHGILVNGDTSRWSNNQYNIVNDQQQDNTTAAVLHYDLSKYKGTKITDATFLVKIDQISADTEVESVNYYYSTRIHNDSGYLVDGGKQTQNLNLGNGSGTTGRDALLNHLQVSSSNLLAKTARTTNITNKLSYKATDTIKKLVDQGYKDLYITIVLNNAGGSGSGKGWSDTKINPANVNFSISYENYDFSSTAVNKEYIDANISDWNMPTTQSVKYNNYDVEINSNVLYSSNTFSDGTDKIFALNPKPQDTNMSSKASAVTNRIVYFYTQAGDEKKVKIPILAEANMVGDVMEAYQINYIALESNSWTFDKTNWYATTNKNTWNDANTSGRAGSYVVSTSTSNIVTDFANQNKSNPKPCEGQFTWRNIVSYNGSVSWKNGYMKVTNPTLKMSFDGWGSWGWRSSDYGAWNNLENTDISLPDNASYYLVDFSTMKDMYSKVKNDYNTIKANEDKYTADSLLNYYKGVQQIVAYNALAYDFSTDASVQQCASDMQTAINAYNTAYAGLVEVPREHTVTFQFDNRTTEERVVSAGAKIGAFPVNTATTSLGNGYHNVYTWNTTLTPDSTLSEDVTITESATADFCDKKTPATCSKGIICSVCGGEYGNVDPDAHTYNVQNGIAECTSCHITITAPNVEESYMITKGNMFDFDAFANSESVNNVSNGGIATVDTEKDTITIFAPKNDVYTGTAASEGYYKISVDPNTNYTLSYQASFEQQSTQVHVFFYKDNGTSASNPWNEPNRNSQNGINTFPFTTPSDCDYIQIRFGTVSSSPEATASVTFSKIALIKDGEGEIINHNVDKNTYFDDAVKDFKDVCSWSSHDNTITSNIDVEYTEHNYVRSVERSGDTYTWLDTCSKCKDVQTKGEVDASAYFDAIEAAQANIDNKVKYTSTSRGELQTFVNNNKLEFVPDKIITIDEINAKVSAIQEANKLKTEDGLLELHPYDVTFRILDNNSGELISESTTRTTTYLYGETASLNLDDFKNVDGLKLENKQAIKWTKQGSSESHIAGTTDSITHVVTDSVTINAYVIDTTPQVSENTYVVKVYNRINKIVGYMYVTQGAKLTIEGSTISDGNNSVTIDKTPFYEVQGYRVKGKEIKTGYVVNSDIDIYPVYTAQEQIIIELDKSNFTNIEFSTTKDTQIISHWDQRVIINTTDGSEVTWYVDGVPVAKGSSYNFRATKSMKISAKADAAISEGASTITYAAFDKENSRARIAVSSLQTNDLVIKEQGLYILTSTKQNDVFTKDDVIKKGKKFVATNKTDTGDQFSFTLNVGATSTVKTFGIVSYVEYQNGKKAYSVDYVNIQVER